MTTLDLPQQPGPRSTGALDVSVAEVPVLDYSAGPRQGPVIWISIQFVLMLAIAFASLFYGLQLRKWAWDQTTDIHFRITMNNCIRWGHHTNSVGKLKVYQELVDEFGDEGDYRGVQGALALDYPPLRLMIISTWEAWTEKHFPPKNPNRVYWQPQYEFTRPMLWLNNSCEIAGAVAMFLLVHYWLRRCAGAPLQPWIDPITGCWQGLLAALLLWFNPAVIFNAHCYPQWDVWILAPFLLAVYLGMLDLWLISGILIGVVAMGKGQILLVTPVLIVWQLCLWRPTAILRLGIGIATGAAAVASPWLLSESPAHAWFYCVLISLGAMLSLFYIRTWSRIATIIQSSVLLVCVMLLLWPWITHLWSPLAGCTLFTLLAFAGAARFLPRRFTFAWFAAGVAGALFACIPLFNSSTAWYTVGISFPTRHWSLLYWCEAMNLGAILQEDFGWDWHDMINLDDYLPHIAIPVVATDVPAAITGHPWIWILQHVQHPWIFPMRYLMITAYFVSLTICGICMAVHYRRKSPMFFFAMVAPWVLMFTLLPQMQNRYLVWGAAFSATTAAFSLDGFMLYLLLAVISVIDTLVDMMKYARQTPFSQKWMPIVDPMFPDVAWAMLLIAGIWLYRAMSPGAPKSTLQTVETTTVKPTLVTPLLGYSGLTPVGSA